MKHLSVKTVNSKSILILRHSFFLWTFFGFQLFTLAQNTPLVISKFSDFPASGNVNHLEVDSFNHLFIGSNAGLTMIDQQTGQQQQWLNGKNILASASIDQANLWAIDSKTLYHVRKNTSYPILEEETTFTDLAVYKGKVYVASTNGLYILNQNSGKFEILNTRNSKLPSAKINVIYADSKGRLWIGTDKGEVRVESEDWKTYHDTKKISHVYENKEGLWFISTDIETKKQEMWLIDHYNREFDAGFGPDLFRGGFNDFCIDSDGKLYFASDAFIRYDPYEEKTTNFTDKAGLLSSKCTSTIADKNNVVWIGTSGEGLFRLVFEESKSKTTAPLSVVCLMEKALLCSDSKEGAIKVIATGGSGDYSYQWDKPGLSGNNPKNVPPGSYSVTVTDKNNNTAVCQLDLLAPLPLGIDLVSMEKIKTVNGKDGRLEVLGTGGAGEYKYRWANGSSKAFLDKIAAGNYSVTITDKNKCTATKDFELTRDKILPDLSLNNLKVGQTLRINELYFKADSTEITSESNAVLEEIYSFLQSHPTVAVEIGGHTNTIPPHEYCDKLSTERAKSVANYFYNKGIDQGRLSYKGYGKRFALTNDSSLEGRRRNQRVEIKIISI